LIRHIHVVRVVRLTRQRIVLPPCFPALARSRGGFGAVEDRGQHACVRGPVRTGSAVRLGWQVLAPLPQSEIARKALARFVDQHFQQ